MTDYELQDLERKRQRAQLLSQTETPRGSMVSGIYVKPNVLEYLASGLRQYSGNKQLGAIDQESQNLRTKREGMDADAMAKFIAPLRGEEARDIQPLTPMDDEGNAMPVARKEAVAPGTLNYGALQGAYSPQLRQMGMQGLITTQQEAAKKAQADALTAKYGQILASGVKPQQAIAMGVPAEFVKAYMEAPNLGRAKVQFKDVGGQLVPVTEYGDTPESVKPIANTTKPTKVQEYEYAKSQGYTGSLADWVAIAPTITANAIAPLRAAQIENIQADNQYNLPQSNTTGVTVQTPTGQVFSFPNQQAANAFKKKAGIK